MGARKKNSPRRHGGTEACTERTTLVYLRRISVSPCLRGCLLSFLVLLTAANAVGAQVEAPAEDAALKLQAEVERRYLKLQSLMSRLLEAVEEARSQETGRVAVALERSRELKIVPRLRTIRRALRDRQLRDALEEEIAVEKDLERILRLLRGLDEAEELKKRKRELEEELEQLERLERITAEQEENVENTRSAQEDVGADDESLDRKAKALSRKEREIRRKTEELRRALERKLAERRERRGQRGEGQGQEGGGQQGSGQQSGGQQGPQGGRQSQRTAEQLRRAGERMQGAAQRLEALNLEGSIEDQEEALEALKRALEELERETAESEERQRELVRSLVVRKLAALLAEQELLTGETEGLHRKAGFGDPEAFSTGSLPEWKAGEARSLARRERTLAADAGDIIRVLENEGSSVVATGLVERVQGDLENVASLLDSSETGSVTQHFQRDIETTLRDLIESLKKTVRAGGGGGGGGGGQPADLITPVMEVKMILAEQKRLRSRTAELERAGVLPENKEQARRLAESEEALSRLVDGLGKKYPEIDRMLLGKEEGRVNEEKVEVPAEPPKD